MNDNVFGNACRAREQLELQEMHVHLIHLAPRHPDQLCFFILCTVQSDMDLGVHTCTVMDTCWTWRFHVDHRRMPGPDQRQDRGCMHMTLANLAT